MKGDPAKNGAGSKAQYLLRFDDLCPTMDRARWLRFARLIRCYKLRPILAIVPDNHDPELEVDPPDAGFWLEMRAWEEIGAATGLHGYRHVCESSGASLIPGHRRTEFAGVPRTMQSEWIAAGLAGLRSRGLHPQVWVAPRHGMDRATLAALQESGISVVSDGLAARPYREHGLLWIPQQLWGPVAKERGLWTICIHPNTATDREVAELEAFLDQRRGQFTSLQRALEDWPVSERTLSDRLLGHWMRMRRGLSRLRAGLGFGSRRGAGA